PIAELIAATDAEAVHRTPIADLSPPLPRFHRDPVVLLADAAHAMTPNPGQGGGPALVDAPPLTARLAPLRGQAGLTEGRTAGRRAGARGRGDSDCRAGAAARPGGPARGLPRWEAGPGSSGGLLGATRSGSAPLRRPPPAPQSVHCEEVPPDGAGVPARFAAAGRHPRRGLLRRSGQAHRSAGGQGAELVASSVRCAQVSRAAPGCRRRRPRAGRTP